jgi:hypothetical protein
MEYRVLVFEDVIEIEDVLNDAGKHGWVVQGFDKIGTIKTGDEVGKPVYKYLLARPLQQEPEFDDEPKAMGMVG